MIEDFTCALAIGISYEKLFLMLPLVICTGGIPSLHNIFAPIKFSGSDTLNIGLFDNDLSPTSLTLIPRLLIKPIISRMPVPEFPRSTSSLGELKAVSLFLIVTLVLLISIDDPIAFKAFIVEIGSSPFKNPSIVIS